MPDNQLPPWMPIVYLCSPGSELQAELPSPELIPVVLKGQMSQPRQTVPFPVPNQPGKSVQVPVPQKSTPPAVTTPITRRGFTAGQDTVRTRIFRMLAKQPMTASEISKAVGHASCPSLVKDEGVCEKPRIRREDGTQYGKRGVVFTLTALGHKHLEQGVVDQHAAPQSFGVPWPEGR
jgi:DNA-binding transcriptional ArsR family regulator